MQKDPAAVNQEKLNCLVGKIVTSVSSLEHRLKTYIAWTADIDEDLAFHMFAGARLKPMLGTLSSVFHFRVSDSNTDATSAFEELIGEIEDIGNLRDEYCHRVWYSTARDEEFISTKHRLAQRKFKHDAQNVKLQELRLFYSRVHSAHRNSITFFHKMFPNKESDHSDLREILKVPKDATKLSTKSPN